MVGYLTSLRVVVCKCVRTRSERMLHATLSLASGVGGSRIAASCADDPQQVDAREPRHVAGGGIEVGLADSDAAPPEGGRW